MTKNELNQLAVTEVETQAIAKAMSKLSQPPTPSCWDCVYVKRTFNALEQGSVECWSYNEPGLVPYDGTPCKSYICEDTVFDAPKGQQ